MNRRHILGLATVLVFAAACQDIDQAVGPTDVDAGPALSVQQQNDRVAPGRILVRLADGADAASVGQAHGVAFGRTIANGRLALFNGAAGNERAIAARMRGDARVVYAEPDYLR